jgi:hypothetical protein
MIAKIAVPSFEPLQIEANLFWEGVRNSFHLSPHPLGVVFLLISMDFRTYFSHCA